MTIRVKTVRTIFWKASNAYVTTIHIVYNTYIRFFWNDIEHTYNLIKYQGVSEQRFFFYCLKHVKLTVAAYSSLIVFVISTYAKALLTCKKCKKLLLFELN